MACDASYVGSTLRAFYVREAEHRGMSHRTGNFLGRPPQSAVRNHSDQCSEISSNSFKFVAYEENPTKLRILESLYIHAWSPSLNDRMSAYKLNIVN